MSSARTWRSPREPVRHPQPAAKPPLRPGQVLEISSVAPFNWRQVGRVISFLETARSIRPAALVGVAEQLDHRAEVPSGQPLWRAAGHERSAEGVLRRVCVGVLRTDDVAGLVIDARGKYSRCVDAR